VGGTGSAGAGAGGAQGGAAAGGVAGLGSGESGGSVGGTDASGGSGGTNPSGGTDANGGSSGTAGAAGADSAGGASGAGSGGSAGAAGTAGSGGSSGIPIRDFVVTTGVDENDAGATVAAPGGAGLSLREAINLANGTAGHQVITFASGITVALASALPVNHASGRRDRRRARHQRFSVRGFRLVLPDQRQ
jgi:hypothetical protein